MSLARVLVPVAVVALGVAAEAAARPAAPATVRVTATEWTFSLSSASVPRGPVVFRITNAGQITHNFVIAGRRSRLVGPGRTVTLRVAFGRPGGKRFLCTLPSHAVAGMQGALTVR